MLASARVCATLPATDLERAKRFSGEALGLAEAAIAVEGGAFTRAARNEAPRERAPARAADGAAGSILSTGSAP